MTNHGKIGKKYTILLILCAAFFDALSLIPGVQPFVTVGGQIVMGSLFFIRGVNVFKNRPAVMYVLTTILEAIPVAGALPFFMVETLTIIGLSRAGKA